ncbi:bifunctional folylpolyglutamate synthase/dihydrofolate synthase [Ornithinibacillus halotolerans]|uniref:tetrahydrofolate synthase n=1 Tax=Ornithinibacillus halotolerans TaxID=1274357 RepID=A0A916WCL8_9BACI|nr:folylpolyglutamate synthase/dihydrofolate synthase family protein [Ornithinibacillus halotolerans]GGA85948.1 bifunctional folylpolyglutamate synthase/dihydrofolate synthase [Ornithinibacillus halotolerans]
MYQNLKQVELFIENRRTLGIKPGLERMNRVLDLHGNPHQNVPFIHIAGTNGKGSTLSFIKGALTSNDYKVGIFTSPSLTGLAGHILINDDEISEEQFVTIFNQLLPTIKLLDAEDLYLTEFEIITAIALLFFRDNVDIAIIETGMGGREDSTNCITPILSIITNVAMDHSHFLGESLEEIAFQKAGIIKQSVPVVIGDIPEECLPIVYKEANEKQSVIYQLNKDFLCLGKSNAIDSQLIEWRHQKNHYQFEIMMQGKHQIANIGLALMALHLLKIKLDWDKVFVALNNVSIPGRFEKVKQHPLIILDGAHNLDGMKALLNTVDDLYKTNRKVLIFAGFRDKELQKMLQIAIPVFDSVIITTFSHPRAAHAEEIVDGIDSDNIIISDWRQALENMNNQEAYFFAGSLHFIGTVRKYITDYR